MSVYDTDYSVSSNSSSYSDSESIHFKGTTAGAPLEIKGLLKIAGCESLDGSTSTDEQVEDGHYQDAAMAIYVQKILYFSDFIACVNDYQTFFVCYLKDDEYYKGSSFNGHISSEEKDEKKDYDSKEKGDDSEEKGDGKDNDSEEEHDEQHDDLENYICLDNRPKCPPFARVKL